MTNAILLGKPQAGSLLCKDVLSAHLVWVGDALCVRCGCRADGLRSEEFEL